MGWLSGKATTPSAPQGYLSGLLGTSGQDAVYPSRNFLSFAKAGFDRNELAYACIVEKATSAPEAPLRVYGPDGLGEPRETHPLRMLLSNPNPHLTEFELFELTVIHLDLAGLAAWEIVTDLGGRPSELWPIRPDRLRFIVHRNGRVTYGIETDRNQVAMLGDNVVLFKYPNPIDIYAGQPPMRPAVRAIALDNEATDFVTALLQNRALPGVVVTTQKALDEDQTTRLRTKWREAFGGTRRGDVAFLQQGMDAKVLGLNLNELEFPDLRTIAEARICSAFGVPPILVGAKVGLDRSTFANYAEARKSLWEETLMPLQRRLRDAIVAQLLPKVTDQQQRPRRVTVKFDHSGVLALKDSEQAIWERATQALRAGAITVADFRRIVGLPFLQGTDVFLRPAGVFPTAADGTIVGGQGPEPDDAELGAMVRAGLEIERRRLSGAPV